MNNSISNTIDTGPESNGLHPLPPLHPSTLAIHADDPFAAVTDVAPPLHLSSTFRYASNPEVLVPARDAPASLPGDAHIYSRHTAPSTTRLEAMLETLLGGPCVCYGSGLAALHAFYVFLNPRVVSIGGGYHGSHGVINLHKKLTGAKVMGLDCDEAELGHGDVIHLETPVNPTGEALSIRKYAEKAQRRGAVLIVDSTFAPPGLQEPFSLGADVVMHSGTKYLGGHSDLLWGVLSTRKEKWVEGLREERTYLGNVMGAMEAWLGVRSLRTLQLRVERQSESATRLVQWLHGILSGKEASRQVGEVENAVNRTVESVKHASLQIKDKAWLQEQMPHGYGPVFAILMKEERLARRLPSKVRLFHHATSLGGVESLIEWRAMSDQTCDQRLCRVSVGAEHWEDLKNDLAHGFISLSKEQQSTNGVAAGERRGPYDSDVDWMRC